MASKIQVVEANEGKTHSALVAGNLWQQKDHWSFPVYDAQLLLSEAGGWEEAATVLTPDSSIKGLMLHVIIHRECSGCS